VLGTAATKDSLKVLSACITPTPASATTLPPCPACF